MNNQTKWISNRIQIGRITLAVGVIVAILGIIAESRFSDLSFNFRIITGLGILIIGIGVSILIRYGAAVKDEQSARRLNVEERDERTVLIRTRAGNKAYWVSAALIYIGLMWESSASFSNLPVLAGDTLWFFLAASTLIPFGVYIISFLMDQRNF